MEQTPPRPPTITHHRFLQRSSPNSQHNFSHTSNPPHFSPDLPLFSSVCVCVRVCTHMCTFHAFVSGVLFGMFFCFGKFEWERCLYERLCEHECFELLCEWDLHPINTDIIIIINNKVRSLPHKLKLKVIGPQGHCTMPTHSHSMLLELDTNNHYDRTSDDCRFEWSTSLTAQAARPNLTTPTVDTFQSLFFSSKAVPATVAPSTANFTPRHTRRDILTMLNQCIPETNTKK